MVLNEKMDIIKQESFTEFRGDFSSLKMYSKHSSRRKLSF